MGIISRDARQGEGGGFLPELLGLDLDAGDGVDADDRAFSDAQRGLGVAQEVREARRVDDVDLGLLPLGVGEAGGQGVLAGDFFFVEVGDRGAFVDLPQPVDGARHEQHRRHQLCFAASTVPDHRDVPDGSGIIDLHKGNPPPAR